MNPKFHHRPHKSQAPGPILSQLNPVYNLISYFFSINVTITLPSTPRSYMWSLSFMFFDKYVLCISSLSHTCYMSRLPSVRNLTTVTISDEQCTLHTSSLLILLPINARAILK